MVQEVVEATCCMVTGFREDLLSHGHTSQKLHVVNISPCMESRLVYVRHDALAPADVSVRCCELEARRRCCRPIIGPDCISYRHYLRGSSIICTSIKRGCLFLRRSKWRKV